MKKTAIIPSTIAALLCAGLVFGGKKATKDLYVRVVNTGTIPTRSYILTEPSKHGRKPIQHFFPGLLPGDTTSYLLFRKLNTCGKVTVVLDTIALSYTVTEMRNNDCREIINEKETVYIKVDTIKQKEGKARLAIVVDYGS